MIATSAAPADALAISPPDLLARPSLRRSFLWTLAGNATYAACQWGAVVVLAKVGSVEMVGQLGLGLAVSAPILQLANLQLRGVQATDARGDHSFGECLALRLATTLCALVTIALVALAAGWRRETALVVLLVGVAKACESVSDVFHGLLQQHERMDRIAKSMMMKGLLSLAALGAGVHLTGNILWGVGGLAAAWTLTLAVYDLRSVSSMLRAAGRAPALALRPRWEPPRLARLAWTSLPLGLVMALGSLNVSIPRYAIEHHLGERELGVFTALASFMVAGSTVMSALWQSATPRLAAYHVHAEHQAFGRLVARLGWMGAGVGVAGVLLALLAGRELVTLVYGADYAVHPEVLVWLMAAAAIQYGGGVLSIAVTAMRRFWVQAPIQSASALATALIAAYGVPRFGLVGAAWAILAASLLSRAAFGLVLARTR